MNGGVKAIGAEAVILLELHFGLHNDASLFVLRFRSTSSRPVKLSMLTMFKLTLSARMRASGDGLDVAATLPEGQQFDAERWPFEAAKRLYPTDLMEYRKGAQWLDRSGAGEG